MVAESPVYIKRLERTDLELGTVLRNKHWSHQYYSIFR